MHHRFGPKAAITLGDNVNLSGLQVNLDRHKEWSRVFPLELAADARLLYDPNLHGVDWLAIRKQYEPLLGTRHHRCDLTYVIGRDDQRVDAACLTSAAAIIPSRPASPPGLLGAGYPRMKRPAMVPQSTRSSRAPRGMPSIARR